MKHQTPNTGRAVAGLVFGLWILVFCFPLLAAENYMLRWTPRQWTNFVSSLAGEGSDTSGLQWGSANLTNWSAVTVFNTNGLAGTNYVNTATNGFTTTSYVNTATNGFVTAAVTNGLATTAYVDTATNGFTTTSYVNTATNGFVTAAVTNGLATTNYVNTATNGFVTQAVTNGLTGSYLTRLVMTTNFTNVWASAANILTNIPQLSFSVTAGTNYFYRAYIYFTTAATTTGTRWMLTTPGLEAYMGQSEYTLTATTSTRNAMVQNTNLPTAANATSAAGANLAILSGFFRPSASGTVSVAFAGEVTNSQVRAQAGSTLEYW